MAETTLPKKPRKSNFSTDEVDVLVDSVKCHYEVLYGLDAKKTTNRWIRHRAWMDILTKVNGVSAEKRTLQEVKNKWKKCQYAMKEKLSQGTLADDAYDSPFEDTDSMPLQERLSKVVAQEKISSGASGQVLKSQPLSPTKLKVTRQTPKTQKAVEPPPSPVNEEMCLRWNSHHSNMQTAFPSILSKEQYVDVTLAAEGKTLKCHRLILSSCSPYFEEVLSGISPFQHPVLFMRDIPFWILKSLCDFMYAGEVHIYQNKLEELLTVAEALKIKGLAGKSTPPENQEMQSLKNEPSNHKDKKKISEKEKPAVSHPPPRGSYSQTNSYDYDDDMLDPLELLEPLYEEVADEKKPPNSLPKPKENKYQYQQVKKPFGRRLRKRKLSEQRDPSPPQVFSFRKGTRSRPNIKIPKYYHPDFTNTPKQATDPLLCVDDIKTEPIDVEDNFIDYSDEEHYLEPGDCDSPIVVSSTPSPSKGGGRKMPNPIIAEVRSVEENNGSGLEVIKITMQPDVNKDVHDPLQENEILSQKSAESWETAPLLEAVGQCDIEETAILIETEELAPNLEAEPSVNNKESDPHDEVIVSDEPIEEEGNNSEDITFVDNPLEAEEESGANCEEAAISEGVGDNTTSLESVEVESVSIPKLRIEDVRTTTEEESVVVSLSHLEKEAMNVANAINLENQAE